MKKFLLLLILVPAFALAQAPDKQPQTKNLPQLKTLPQAQFKFVDVLNKSFLESDLKMIITSPAVKQSDVPFVRIEDDNESSLNSEIYGRLYTILQEASKSPADKLAFVEYVVPSKNSYLKISREDLDAFAKLQSTSGKSAFLQKLLEKTVKLDPLMIKR